MTEFEKGYEQGYKDGTAGAALPNVNDNGDKIDGYSYAYKTDSNGEPYIHIDSVRGMLKEAKEKNNLSIDKYVPLDYNTHTVRITFNWCGAVGHISYVLKGNCKGADILESALDFISDCDMNDIENLVENDCHLAMTGNDDTIFCLHLHKDKNNDVMLSELDEKEVEELIVAVEIVDCKGEIEIEDV